MQARQGWRKEDSRSYLTDDQRSMAPHIKGAPLKTPFNCQPLKLFKNNLRDTSLSLSHLAPARLPRDASSHLVLFEFD